MSKLPEKIYKHSKLTKYVIMDFQYFSISTRDKPTQHTLNHVKDGYSCFQPIVT